ncbi:metal-dependent hydrolase family protein [Paracraurococcus ruber]|uniref:Amidohydrolase n=1 Tax=Paracraurococcus ruber TaxID=77675 RepID=A0ABS1CSE9_9PROT|nr:amidohydrolase family protein [Paracraurococcus ruber]MBK1657260.1 amidohydrolase [Paracraurococcus ruber]TDG33148.1 amidohydrolase family protein [Paracraurococcus ruber]
MTRVLIRNAQVFDATGRAPYPADVLVEGNRIKAVATDLGVLEAPEVIDGAGMTLMPGMVEGHSHPTFTGVSEPAQLGEIPPEEHLILTIKNTRLMLDHGFTALFEAASAKLRLGVVTRNAINAGDFIGPRMRAASPEITTTAGLGDERRVHIYRESFALIADGPEEMRKVARLCMREGVDNLKINVSGDDFVTNARAACTPMMRDEIRTAVEVAHEFGRMVVAHSRSAESVKRCVEAGVDCIYHCDQSDEEALDLLERNKNRHFVAPAFGILYNLVHETEKTGVPRSFIEERGFRKAFDVSCETYHQMRKRGIRVAIGGDYGFAFTPQGQNARDIHHFVRFFGYSPIEALQCATTVGADLMGMKHELGLVKEGYLADLLLVRGDPTQDVTLLQHPDNLAMVMTDGRLWKDPRREIRREKLPLAAE